MSIGVSVKLGMPHSDPNFMDQVGTTTRDESRHGKQL